jgi:hypothetical protein
LFPAVGDKFYQTAVNTRLALYQNQGFACTSVGSVNATGTWITQGLFSTQDAFVENVVNPTQFWDGINIVNGTANGTFTGTFTGSFTNNFTGTFARRYSFGKP